MGLNLDKLSELQKRVRDQMLCRGYPEDADDASQEYALKILEGKGSHQLIDYFCIDYIRKHYGDSRSKNQFKTITLDPKYIEKLLYFDGRERFNSEIDYKTIMTKVLAIKNSRHRRIMIFYFFSGLYPKEIARREGLRPISVMKAIYRSLARIRASVLSERLKVA